MSVFPAGVIPAEETGLFGLWQPRYAARGIVTFPVIITPDGDKRPAIKGYLKIGPRTSAEITIKFADANAFGFVCGPRSRITVVDLDDTDEAIVREGERLFGVSPVLWRTGGGKFAMPFRHNGERRLIRPLSGLSIDLLGGGLVVAPPSIGQFRPYEFLHGSLADFDDLPFARIPEEIASQIIGRHGNRPASLRAVKNGVRHKTMLHELLTHAPHCDDIEALRDVATTINSNNFEPPLEPGDIEKAISQAWKYQTTGQNWVGKEQRVHAFASELDAFDAHKNGPYGLRLLLELRRHHKDGDEFAISPKPMAEAQVIPGWSARAYRFGRDAMIEVGAVDVMHNGGSGPGDAYLFSFAKAGIHKGANSAPNTKKIPLPLVPEGIERPRRAAGDHR